MAKPPVFTPAQRDVLGDVLRQLRTEIATERDQAIARELDGTLRYAGTWDSERGYPRGAMITHAGACWIAITGCARGEKPGRGPGWKLAAKGEKPEGPTR